MQPHVRPTHHLHHTTTHPIHSQSLHALRLCPAPPRLAHHTAKSTSSPTPPPLTDNDYDMLQFEAEFILSEQFKKLQSFHELDALINLRKDLLTPRVSAAALTQLSQISLPKTHRPHIVFSSLESDIVMGIEGDQIAPSQCAECLFATKRLEYTDSLLYSHIADYIERNVDIFTSHDSALLLKAYHDSDMHDAAIFKLLTDRFSVAVQRQLGVVDVEDAADVGSRVRGRGSVLDEEGLPVDYQEVFEQEVAEQEVVDQEVCMSVGDEELMRDCVIMLRVLGSIIQENKQLIAEKQEQAAAQQAENTDMDVQALTQAALRSLQKSVAPDDESGQGGEAGQWGEQQGAPRLSRSAFAAPGTYEPDVAGDDVDEGDQSVDELQREVRQLNGVFQDAVNVIVQASVQVDITLLVGALRAMLLHEYKDDHCVGDVVSMALDQMAGMNVDQVHVVLKAMMTLGESFDRDETIHVIDTLIDELELKRAPLPITMTLFQAALRVNYYDKIYFREMQNMFYRQLDTANVDQCLTVLSTSQQLGLLSPNYASNVAKRITDQLESLSVDQTAQFLYIMSNLGDRNAFTYNFRMSLCKQFMQRYPDASAESCSLALLAFVRLGYVRTVNLLALMQQIQEQDAAQQAPNVAHAIATLFETFGGDMAAGEGTSGLLVQTRDKSQARRQRKGKKRGKQKKAKMAREKQEASADQQRAAQKRDTLEPVDAGKVAAASDEVVCAMMDWVCAQSLQYVLKGGEYSWKDCAKLAESLVVCRFDGGDVVLPMLSVLAQAAGSGEIKALLAGMLHIGTFGGEPKAIASFYDLFIKLADKLSTESFALCLWAASITGALKQAHVKTLQKTARKLFEVNEEVSDTTLTRLSITHVHSLAGVKAAIAPIHIQRRIARRNAMSLQQHVVDGNTHGAKHKVRDAMYATLVGQLNMKAQTCIPIGDGYLVADVAVESASGKTTCIQVLEQHQCCLNAAHVPLYREMASSSLIHKYGFVPSVLPVAVWDSAQHDEERRLLVEGVVGGSGGFLWEEVELEKGEEGQVGEEEGWEEGEGEGWEEGGELQGEWEGEGEEEGA